MALTPKQQAFVNEYLTCWNASEAARRAGYSVNTASEQGSRLLGNANIGEEIKRRVADMTMSANEVLVRLTEQARGSMDDFVTFYDGVRLPILDLAKAHADGKMGLVKKLKYTDQGGMEFELYDAQSALTLIGKAHKLFVDKQEITGKDGGAIPINVVDYRNGLAQIATGSDDDSGASGED